MKSVAQAVRWPMWRQLHIRAALVAVPLLLTLGATMFLMLRHYSAQTALEAGQRMNLDLARYVVENQPPDLIRPDGEPDRVRMKELAMNVMMINPAVEVYLLDGGGRVLAHALQDMTGADPVGQRVDLAPVLLLLDGTSQGAARLPVLGVDPRSTDRLSTFSVARAASTAGPAGYLYIVLNSSTAQNVAASLSNSDALRAMAMGVAAATALAVAVLVIAWQTLTRPLRSLTDELRSFRGDAESGADRESGDEIGVLRRAVLAMQERIAQQFKRLEDGDRQRRELVSNISHDLRTPLTSIQGYLETVLLRGEEIGAQTRAAHLRTALRHVDLLGKRIGDLFELSKLDADRALPKQEVFRLAELLQDVVQNHQLSAQRRGVQLKLADGSHTRATVRADIAMIERVLQNLIDNALRHTAAGGHVTLAIRICGAFMEISVSDTGRGIAKDDLPHIFERYWCATAADQAGPGTSSGLGLAIVKRILDLHGSAVRVHSELKRGTRFAFLLPQVA